MIEKTRLYETTEAAVADLHHVYAATVRPRTMTKRVITPRQAAPEYVEASQKFETSGVMFGPEAMGLSNDDIALADTVLTAPVNPECPSLNLAQAVFMVGYEWYQHLDQTPQEFVAIPKETTLATKKDLGGLFVHMETELEACGFLRVEERRSILIRNIRNVFQRAGMTEQEVRTFRGIIKHLVRGKPS